MLRRLALCVALVVAGVGIPATPAFAADFTVLVFSKTAGFRHDSIPSGIAAIQQLGAANNFTVEATEDANQFNDTNLARFGAVIWLSTTADVLDATQQAAFERYIRAGHGYVGIHAAADTEYDWPWYGGLVGAYFQSHPAIQSATIRVEDRVHPASAPLPADWTRTDEWYNYRTNPRSFVHVLARLDEATYSGGSMGTDHPISWCRAYDGGRMFYTGLGHTIESYGEANYRTHLLGGIRYAATGTGDCSVGTPPPPPPPSGDLARGRPATASSLESAAFPASNAVDGNAGTRWSSQYSDPQWIQVDLGTSTSITRVRLAWEAAFGSAYQVQTSATGTTWTTIRSVTGGNGGEDDLTGLTGTGRFVRINGTTRATQWGYSLFSFEVYGGGTPPPPPPPPSGDLARGKPVTASSVENGSFPASNAVDGNAATRWSSAFSDPQWIQVDLGVSTSIVRVRLAWEAAFGSAYQVQTSATGTTWTTVRSVTGGNGGEDDLTGLTGTGRFVRINGTTRATPYGYSLFSFEVYSS